jgi:hypothetical protein
MKRLAFPNLNSDSWLMTYRVIAAILGGFALTLTSSMLLSQLLAIFITERANASITAMLISFTIYTVIVMWVFTVESVKTVWIKLLSGIAITGFLVWVIKFLELV